MVLTYIKKVRHSMLCVTGVYLSDITDTIFFPLQCESSERLLSWWNFFFWGGWGWGEGGSVNGSNCILEENSHSVVAKKLNILSCSTHRGMSDLKPNNLAGAELTF